MGSLSEENEVNFDAREVLTARTVIWKMGWGRKSRGRGIRIAKIVLVSAIPVLTVVIRVVLTGRIDTKRI